MKNAASGEYTATALKQPFSQLHSEIKSNNQTIVDPKQRFEICNENSGKFTRTFSNFKVTNAELKLI